MKAYHFGVDFLSVRDSVHVLLISLTLVKNVMKPVLNDTETCIYANPAE